MTKRLAWLVIPLALGLGATAACSLTLPSEDSYFARDAASGVDSSADASAVETGSPAEAGAGSEASADAGGIDAAEDGQGAPAEASAGDSAVDGGLPFDASVLAPASLVVWYPFETIEVDAGVSSTPDKSGNGNDGLLLAYVADAGADAGVPPSLDPSGHSGSALRLDSTEDQYVQLPAGILSTFTNGMSVSCWLYLRTGAIWDRLFDFNSSPAINWVYFSPTGWNTTTSMAGTHFAISTSGQIDPEMELTQVVAPGVWHHIAVVLNAPYLMYYLDGNLTYFTDKMTEEPSGLGVTPHDWLGRSSYPADPYLNASIDEFRLYSGGLTPEQVQQLAGSQ